MCTTRWVVGLGAQAVSDRPRACASLRAEYASELLIDAGKQKFGELIDAAPSCRSGSPPGTVAYRRIR
jgi:hypothetical protein